MKNKEDAKHKILEAAKKCFASNGYTQTSVRQICEVADVNLALVSYYYGSKEKLYITILEELFQENIGKIPDHPVESPIEELEQFIKKFLQLRNEDKQFLMILRHELNSENSRRKLITKIILPYFSHLKNILIAGKKQGIFHYESLNTMLMMIASILVYPAYESILLDFFPSQNEDRQNESHRITRFILHGLTAKN